MEILSIDELASELRAYIDTGVESQLLKNHNIAMLMAESVKLKKHNIFKQYYSLYEKARLLEKDKKIEEALTIYMKIMDKYIPEGSSYYERPCILLEKLKRYDEAIEICNLAIIRSKSYKYNFPIDEFEKRLNRLIKKRDKGQ